MRSRYPMAEDLERVLADPLNSENELSYSKMMQLDEKDAYPENFCQKLTDWNLHHHYVPTQLGGKLTSYEELMALLRVVSRRDMTAAWGHGLNTYLGAANVWLSGNEAQKRELAQIILAGHQAGVAYHEKEHGSDLLSSEVEANATESGFSLRGTKWVVGNATRSKTLTVFARTSARGGERGFSLFLVNKDELPPESYSYLAKIKTHGIRGSDVSGIRFENTPLKAGSIVGSLGGALESTMKAFQVTRTLVPGLSLGVGDSALRLVLQFMVSRKAYGGPLLSLPSVESELVDAFLDLLICECIAIAGARGLHATPNQMSVWSAVIKYFVPTTIDQAIHRLSVLLGARYYLREEYCSGVFQKIWRDHSVACFSHAPTYLNLSIISQNLPQIFKVRGDLESLSGIRLKAVFDLDQQLPEFDGSRLALHNRGREDITQGIRAALRSGDLGTHERIVELSRLLLGEMDALEGVYLELSTSLGREFQKSPEAFEMAKRFCVIFAAASCLHMWVHSRNLLGEFFSKDYWLEMSLERLLGQLRPSQLILPRRHVSEVSEELQRRFREGELFSIVPT